MKPAEAYRAVIFTLLEFRAWTLREQDAGNSVPTAFESAVEIMFYDLLDQRWRECSAEDRAALERDDLTAYRPARRRGDQ